MGKGSGISRDQDIETYLDWKVVIALPLVVWALTGAILTLLHSQWDWALAWGTALVAPLLFLAALLAYEIVNASGKRRNARALEKISTSLRARGFAGTNVTSVPPNIPISSLLNDYIIAANQFDCPVIDHGRLVGFIRFTDIRKVPMDKWDLTEVGEIMTSVNQLLEEKNMA